MQFVNTGPQGTRWKLFRKDGSSLGTVERTDDRYPASFTPVTTGSISHTDMLAITEFMENPKRANPPTPGPQDL